MFATAWFVTPLLAGLSPARVGALCAAHAPYFFIEVKKQLEKRFTPDQIASNGYIVQTTLDMNLQRKSQAAVEKSLSKLDKKRGFKGPIARHGIHFEEALRKIVRRPLSEEENERAIVVDIYPKLNAVAIAAQQGLGLLLLEDHAWALQTSQAIGSRIFDFSNILKVGDEIHAERLERSTPTHIAKNQKEFRALKDILKIYDNQPTQKGIGYYKLTDTEGVEAAGLIIDSKSGDILTMIGGQSFLQSQFNRATQAKRQVGSIVKPLYYAYAQDLGFSPASLIDSPPIVIGDWKPENYSREFIGRTNLRSSLIHSYNIPSIQLVQAIGLQATLNHLQRLGLNWSAETEGLSVALGAGEATLFDMVRAYSPFANSGRLTEPRYIIKITDKKGNVIFDATKGAQIISPAAAHVTTRIMQDIIRFGTGTAAAGVSPYAAGKTGSTNNYTDSWFIGVLPNMVAGVWIGFDDAGKSLGAASTGGKIAAPIWREMMLPAVANYPPQPWSEPPGVHLIRVNLETGELSPNGTAMTVCNGTEPGSPNARNALGILGLNGESKGQSESSNPSSDDTNELRSLN